MRVYLPCTLPALGRAVEAGELGPAPLTGYAVTPALIEWYASGDTEELEYVALTEAARASLRMLAATQSPREEEPLPRLSGGSRGAEPPGRREEEPLPRFSGGSRGAEPPGDDLRRVVVAAEVPDRAIQAGADLEEKGRVRISEPVPLAKVAAVHVDDEYAVADVKAAVAALPDADRGDDDARFVVDGAEAHELLWYATQEIPDLLHP